DGSLFGPCRLMHRLHGERLLSTKFREAAWGSFPHDPLPDVDPTVLERGTLGLAPCEESHRMPVDAPCGSASRSARLSPTMLSKGCPARLSSARARLSSVSELVVVLSSSPSPLSMVASLLSC